MHSLLNMLLRPRVQKTHNKCLIVIRNATWRVSVGAILLSHYLIYDWKALLAKHGERRALWCNWLFQSLYNITLPKEQLCNKYRYKACKLALTVMPFQLCFEMSVTIQMAKSDMLYQHTIVISSENFFYVCWVCTLKSSRREKLALFVYTSLHL